MRTRGARDISHNSHKCGDSWIYVSVSTCIIEVFPTPGAPNNTTLTSSGASGLFRDRDTGEHGEQETSRTIVTSVETPGFMYLTIQGQRHMRTRGARDISHNSHKCGDSWIYVSVSTCIIEVFPTPAAPNNTTLTSSGASGLFRDRDTGEHGEHETSRTIVTSVVTPGFMYLTIQGQRHRRTRGARDISHNSHKCGDSWIYVSVSTCIIEVFPTPGAPNNTTLTSSGASGLFRDRDTGEHGEHETSRTIVTSVVTPGFMYLTIQGQRHRRTRGARDISHNSHKCGDSWIYVSVSTCIIEVFPTPGAPNNTTLTSSGASGLFRDRDTGEHGEQETSRTIVTSVVTPGFMYLRRLTRMRGRPVSSWVFGRDRIDGQWMPCKCDLTNT
ncbi:hypothetical protein J6590_078789 [Homalodisca vitripennis]|nr:hypothetical protein J6590_078789 [Homalodisca vitripennis]